MKGWFKNVYGYILIGIGKDCSCWVRFDHMQYCLSKDPRANHGYLPNQWLQKVVTWAENIFQNFIRPPSLMSAFLAQLTFSRTRAKTGQIFCVTAGTHRGHEIIRHQCDRIFTAELISLGIGMSVFAVVFKGPNLSWGCTT